MRLYNFVNMYLSDRHIGIQASHASNILVFKNHDNPAVADWVMNHKTTICLNGGDHESLKEIGARFMFDQSEYANQAFTEPGLNDAYTAVSIVVPEKIYETARICREKRLSAQILFDLCYTEDVMEIAGDMVNAVQLTKTMFNGTRPTSFDVYLTDLIATSSLAS